MILYKQQLHDTFSRTFERFVVRIVTLRATLEFVLSLLPCDIEKFFDLIPSMMYTFTEIVIDEDTTSEEL